jgi:hypothetical protein
MQKQINSVKEFHKAFKLGIVKFQLPRWNAKYAKVSFDEEENEEYLEAVQMII